MANLIERYRDQILGVLSCFDRVVIRGTLPSVCHADAMAALLDSRGIRLFARLTSPSQAFASGVAPFVVADLVKLAIGALLLPSAQKLIAKL